MFNFQSHLFDEVIGHVIEHGRAHNSMLTRPACLPATLAPEEYSGGRRYAHPVRQILHVLEIFSGSYTAIACQK